MRTPRSQAPRGLIACFLPLAMLAGSATLVGCSSDDGPDSIDPLTEGGKYPADGVVNYYEHVKPIYRNRCNSCHTKDAIAPFELDKLKSARKWASLSKYNVTNRIMPPFLMRDDGDCGSYKDSGWLSDDEISTIQKWVDANMPAGDPAKDPGKAAPLATLTGATEYEIPFDYMPVNDAGKSGLFDDYRCFPIQLNLKKDQYVTGVEVIPGHAEIVHHVLAFAISPNAIALDLGKVNHQVLAGLEATHASRPGWPCYAAAGEGVAPGPLMTAWAPGSGAVIFPAGTGLKVKKDDILVVQMHYNVVNNASKDRTKIRLKYVDKVDSEAWFVLHDPFLFKNVFGGQEEALKAGQKEVLYPWTATRKTLTHTLPDSATIGDDLLIHGVFPHMHKRGTKMRMTIKEGAGAETCAAELHHWDFNWQRMYYYNKPLLLTDKTVMKVTCTYDTSGESNDIKAGFGTNDEMCLMGYYISKRLK